MKLIIAIVDREDAGAVTRGLTQAGFSSTRLATTGGFLGSDNATILVGVDAERVQAALSVIKSQSHARRQLLPADADSGYGYHPATPVEITVGGATMFVVDVEHFERI